MSLSSVAVTRKESVPRRWGPEEGRGGWWGWREATGVITDDFGGLGHTCSLHVGSQHLSLKLNTPSSTADFSRR